MLSLHAGTGSADPMIDVVVRRRVLETQDIVVLELADVADRGLPDFTAGAHIDLVLGEGLTRQYSLCRLLCGKGDSYEIGVLRDAQSRGGSVAAHQLGVGDVVRISPPRNHFPLATGSHATLLFGGGIGVTPMLAMAEQLHREGADFQFHYCARSRPAAAFLDRLASAVYASRVFLHFDDGEDGQRLYAAAVFANARDDAHAYVCGPAGFMAHVLETGAKAGWPDARLHAEFFRAPDDGASQAGAAFQIRLASSDVAIDVGETESIARALQRHGIAVEVSCEAGVCGTCLTGVLEGLPDHRDYYLSDQEKARNDQMMVCCSRARSAHLVLDI